MNTHLEALDGRDGISRGTASREGISRADTGDRQGGPMIRMRLQTVTNRYAAFAGMVVLGAALLTAISLTFARHQWSAFLWGVLAAAVLALASRTVNARWIIARRTAQLIATRANS